MEIGIGLLDTGMFYIQQGLEFVRGILNKVAGLIPFGETTLVVTIIFLLASLWAGNFIVKRFVTHPFQFPYLIYYLIISISIFLNLMYL